VTAKHSMTPSIARSLCDSGASCQTVLWKILYRMLSNIETATW